MSANWDLAGDFINGASLAARIAGQRSERDIERQKLALLKTNEAAASTEKSGYTPEELSVPGGPAAIDIRTRMSSAAAAKQNLEGAQADYYAGKNQAYIDAARARAGAMAARVAAGGLADLQKQIKDYDQMSMIDPDGSKGIYTSRKAQEHAALLNAFSMKQGISMPAPAPGVTAPRGNISMPPMSGMSPISDLAGGMATKAAGGLMNYFGGGGAPAPAAPGAAMPYTHFANGPKGRIGYNPNTSAWEPVGAAGGQ